jgi:hypothetical protein
MAVLAVTAPVWAPVVAAAWIVVKLDGRLDPPRWHRVFALWPVECDPWPEDGYSGWVWLESVWRNRNAPGWTKYRREAPRLPEQRGPTDAQLGPGGEG